MKTEIILQKSWSAEKEQLHLRFDYDLEIIQQLRKIKGSHWSREGKCWIIPGGKEFENYLKQLFPEHPLTWFHSPSTPELASEKINTLTKSISIITQEALHYREWLLQRRYSLNTIKVYVQSVDFFLRSMQPKTPAAITKEDAEEFLCEQVVKKGLSIAYQRQLINALKLFYGSFYKTGLDVNLLILPRKNKTLPKVISLKEVEMILRVLTNQKHRTALLLLYACGLRRSELLNLTLKDIDSHRGLLIIRQSKGNKDRLVPLPEKLIEALRSYYKIYRPQHFLFEGQAGPGKQYSAKSLEQILKQAVNKSGINKNVNLHMLRHSYATHQLEAGVNLRYIQEILGHKSPNTTQIYTHVTENAVRKISSPVEKLNIW